MCVDTGPWDVFGTARTFVMTDMYRWRYGGTKYKTGASVQLEVCINLRHVHHWPATTFQSSVILLQDRVIIWNITDDSKLYVGIIHYFLVDRVAVFVWAARLWRGLWTLKTCEEVGVSDSGWTVGLVDVSRQRHSVTCENTRATIMTMKDNKWYVVLPFHMDQIII